MGQYWKAVLVDKQGNTHSIDPRACDSWHKLMEHSYVTSSFVDHVMNRLWENPQRVVWMGDYAGGVISRENTKTKLSVERQDKLMALYNYAWGNRGHDEPSPTLPGPFNPLETCFLVNMDKKVYIDMDKYIQRSIGADNYCIAPLPLLTAISNGEGGGDYFGHIGEEFVGTWAFDTIMATEKRPDPGEFTELTDITF